MPPAGRRLAARDIRPLRAPPSAGCGTGNAGHLRRGRLLRCYPMALCRGQRGSTAPHRACRVPKVRLSYELQRYARCQPQDMMIGRVRSPALPDLHPALRLAGPARPVARVQERRAAGAAARGRRAAPREALAPAGLGRPRGPGRADPAPAWEATGAPAGHARYRAAVAPPPGRREMGLPAPDGAGRRSAPRSPR
jgi:hypothetical protein